MADSTEYQTNRLLSVFPRPDAAGLVIETLEPRGRYRVGDPTVMAVLERASDWVTQGELVAYVTDRFGVEEQTARDTVAGLIDRSFLVAPDSRPARLAGRWADTGWEEAFRYYCSIVDYPFVDYTDDGTETDEDRMAAYSETAAPPEPVKRYDDAPVVSLPTPDPPAVTVEDAVGLPDFTDRPGVDRPSERQLGRLLNYGFGAFGSRETDNEGELLWKAVPSCGARHPTEGYVAVFDVEGVAPGVYHYAPRQHALYRLRDDEDVRERIQAAVPELAAHDASFGFVVFFTSLLARSMWRYRQPRAYTQLHHDIGHVVETLRLAANAEGLDYHYNQGFDDERLYRYLGLDRFREPIFAYLGCGRYDHRTGETT